ncbi:MAG: hypothetical protein J6K65_02045 [Alphaproteobacteria bacterium]|nr:hypothetical protein [Alphaproteobacteria bacterium]
MAGSLAVVSDFDGTISRDDFFWLIADKYFDAPALEPWNLYLRGEMSHLDALNAIFSQIRLPEEELYSFIDSIVWDKSLSRLLNIVSVAIFRYIFVPPDATITSIA